MELLWSVCISRWIGTSGGSILLSPVVPNHLEHVPNHSELHPCYCVQVHKNGEHVQIYIEHDLRNSVIVLKNTEQQLMFPEQYLEIQGIVSNDADNVRELCGFVLHVWEAVHGCTELVPKHF